MARIAGADAEGAVDEGVLHVQYATRDFEREKALVRHRGHHEAIARE